MLLKQIELLFQKCDVKKWHFYSIFSNVEHVIEQIFLHCKYSQVTSKNEKSGYVKK